MNDEKSNTYITESHAEHTNEELYQRQMRLLQTFRENGAISEEQYRKSAGDLAAKTGHEAPPECKLGQTEQKKSSD